MYRSQINKSNQAVLVFPWKKIYATFAFAVFAAPLAIAQSSHALGSGGSLKVEIFTGGQLTDLPAQVVVASEGSTANTEQTVCNDGMAVFGSLPAGVYSVTVHIPGFNDGKGQAQVFGDGMAETTVELDPSDDARTQQSGTGFMLAPKAKKDLELGLDAIQASRFDQAQQHLNAAYNLAPGDPDVSSALGELYLIMKNLDEAQHYIEHATSVAPDNLNALVEMGQLRMLQNNPAAAQPALEHAVDVAPRDKFAHWLLGMAYLEQGLYEKAKDEAVEVVKINKSAATDGEFLLGEALAGLGRTAEAIETLKTFVKKVPHDAYTPYAQNLIAKLQSQPTP